MKKIYHIVFAFSLLIISPHALCFEEYDYTPMDGDNYSGNDNYYSQDSDRNFYQPIGKKRHSHHADFPKEKNNFTGPGKTFVFDPKMLRWFAFYNGNLVNSGRASGGRFYCSDIRRPCKTPVGVFRIGRKGGPECKSNKYPIGRGHAPMPWCMFFHKGFAIHGSWSVPGYNASHGCIRVPPRDAHWLNSKFLSSGSKVIVKSYR
jgi:hypothetical protein